MPTPVPVHLICGFLGAGKTTLVRSLLCAQPADESLAVLVNEFGELGIDGKLLEGFDSTVRELRGGCICCELRVNFMACLQDILHGFNPGRIVVETTGLADPGDIITEVERASAGGRLELASVATVVDAELFLSRDMFGSTYFNQIRLADLVLLNKTDLLEAPVVEELMEELHKIAPQARILPVVRCTVDRDLVLSPLGPRKPNRTTVSYNLDGLAKSLQTLAGLEDKPDHTPGSGNDGFTALKFEHPGVMDPVKLDEVLANLEWEVFRVKGFVRLPQGPRILNYTFRRPEFSDTHYDGPTSLALVAWRVDPDEILARLQQCIQE